MLIEIEYPRQNFSENIQLPNFIKIRSVGAALFHADRQTDRRMDRQIDMTNLIVAFHNFANAPKNRKKKCDHSRLNGMTI